MRKYVISDPEKCSGCCLCELICSGVKERVFNPEKARIRVIKESPGFSIAFACHFCNEPPCVAACPNEALSADENGVLSVAEENCTACGVCVEACEFGVLILKPDAELPVACDLCGGEPQCIKFCPESALKLATFEEIVDGMRDENLKKAVEKLI